MDESLDFTPGRTKDLPRILEIIRQAQRQMRQAGSRQWQDGYPSARDIMADLAAGRGWTLRLREQAVAYAAVGFDGNLPTCTSTNNGSPPAPTPWYTGSRSPMR